MSEYHIYDPSGHIKAISLLLKNAANFTAEKSENLAKTAYCEYGEFGEMLYGDDFHTSVYCDAAYSHLVASSLSTFFESFFFHEFHNIKDDYDISSPLNDSTRWKAQSAPDFWNVRKVIKENGKTKEDILNGIKQLFEALDIPIPIYKEKWLLLETLFHYRNFVVHNGFEWRQQRIDEFFKIINRLKVSDYFKTATSGDQIWIIYMSKEFEDSLVDLAFELVSLFDLWCSNKFEDFMKNTPERDGPEKSPAG